MIIFSMIGFWIHLTASDLDVYPLVYCDYILTH